MSIRPFPNEQGRFFVQSRSRDLEHTVDLQWQEEPNKKPHAQCGCERSFIYGESCVHIKAAVDYEKARLNL